MLLENLNGYRIFHIYKNTVARSKLTNRLYRSTLQFPVTNLTVPAAAPQPPSVRVCL